MVTNSNSAVSVSDTQGNTYSEIVDQTDGSAGDETLVFVALNAKALSSTDTITVTYPTATEEHLVVDEYSGVTAVDQHASNYSTTNLTQFSVSTTAVTTAAKEMVIGVAGVQGGNPTAWTNPTTPLPTLYLPGASDGDQLATAYQTVTTTGTYSVSGTISKGWMAAVITLK